MGYCLVFSEDVDEWNVATQAVLYSEREEGENAQKQKSKKFIFLIFHIRSGVKK